MEDEIKGKEVKGGNKERRRGKRQRDGYDAEKRGKGKMRLMELG